MPETDSVLPRLFNYHTPKKLFGGVITIFSSLGTLQTFIKKQILIQHKLCTPSIAELCYITNQNSAIGNTHLTTGIKLF